MMRRDLQIVGGLQCLLAVCLLAGGLVDSFGGHHLRAIFSFAAAVASAVTAAVNFRMAGRS
jgi:hypothetical protein